MVAGVLEALDSTLGRIGHGTSTVSMSLQLSSGATVTRSNTYSDRFDIALWSLNEISEAVGMVAFNEDTAVELLSVSIDASVSPEIRTARIESITTDVDAVEPGDTLKVQVVLRPYRSQTVVREVEVSVPADAAPGYAHLSVRGGSEMLGSYAGGPLSEPQSGDVESEPYPPEQDLISDLDSQLEEFAARPRGTDLIIDLYLPSPPEPEDGVGDAPDRERPNLLELPPVPAEFEDELPREDEHDERQVFPAARTPYAADGSAGPVRVVVPLDWVVYGYEELGVEVLGLEELGPDTEESDHWTAW